jgi:competence protein ComEC
MVNTAIAMALGSVFAFYGNILPGGHWIAWLPALLAFAFLLPRYRFLILLVASFLWASLFIQQTLNSRLASDFDGQIVQISGVIADIPEQRAESVRFLLKPDFIEGYSLSLPELIRLSWYRTGKILQVGERWQLQVKLRVPSGYQNPGGFDYERWLFVKRIGATGYVKSSRFNRRTDEPSLALIDRWRSRIKQGIDDTCSDCDNKGLIKALAIGYRADIDPVHRQILQDTGTAHLLAISGLHIGIVSALFFFIGRLLWRLGCYRLGFNRPLFSATLAIAAALVYAALAGFALPTLRALIMLSVIFLAFNFRTGINLLNSIAIAVIVILIFDPLSVGSASFWLSISALLLIAFAQYLMVYQRSRWQQVLTLQLVFSLLFIPISIGLFGQLNPASLVANIVAIPLVSLVIVPLDMLGSLVAGLDWPIGYWLFKAVDWALSLLLDYLELLLNSGLAAIHSGGIPPMILALSTLGLVLLMMPSGFPGKKPAVLLMVLPLLWQTTELEVGSYKMTVLDVGMGTSVVVETRHHSLVYDFGPGNAQGFSAAQWVLEPYLRRQGIRNPDMLIISHVDQDHSGGFYSYVNTYDPAKLVSGTPAEVAKKFALTTPIKSCHQYSNWRWDGVLFEFLSLSAGQATNSSNNRSCVLKISGWHTSLLAGDIESEQEFGLVEAMPDKLPAAVLLVPHHGSTTSSTPEFLQRVKPEYSLFTVGKDNRWGFPKARILENYRAINSQILRTDLLGAISVYSKQAGLEVEGYRQRRVRVWY